MVDSLKSFTKQKEKLIPETQKISLKTYSELGEESRKRVIGYIAKKSCGKYNYPMPSRIEVLSTVKIPSKKR